jgi:ABC-type transport system substrate-binding protein
MSRLLLFALTLLMFGEIFPGSAQGEIALRLALPEGDLFSLDPQEYRSLPEAWVLRNVVEGLVGFDPQTLEIVPLVADSWVVSTDGLRYTFHIREGIKFHNGLGVKARDVVNVFNRLAKPPQFIDMLTDSAPLIVGNIAGYNEVQSRTADSLSGIQAVNDRTVIITLTSPNSAFLPMLTMIPVAIIPIEASNSGAFQEHPVGTGPFIFEEWLHLDRVSLVANPDYWGGRPAVDRVTLYGITDDTVVMSDLLAGNLDLAVVPPMNIAAVKADPAFAGRIQDQPLLSIFWLPLNLTRPPLDNLMVRQAMSAAIDRQAIVDTVLQGQGVAAHGPIPPVLSAYDPAYDPYPYNPDRAREYLAQAGFASGIDVEISTSTDEIENRVVAAVQANWRDVGIRATINRTDSTAYAGNLFACNLQIGTNSWAADYADPDDFIIPLPLSDNHPSGEACGFGQFPEVEDLALEALTLPQGPERDALYRQAERVAVENAMGIFLYHRSATLAWGPNVQGAYLNAYGEVYLHPISLG